MPRHLLTLALLSLMLLRPAIARAQGASPAARVMAGPGEIRGRVTEIGTGRGITSGSVTVRTARDSAFAGGALPRADGSFVVDGLRPGRYTVRVRALGFAPVVRAAEITLAEPVVDVGAIVVSPVAAQALAGQEVVAEREDVALAPDRNSYSTKNMATASGGTAVDVLRNVPSVEVDGSNAVSLRGNANVVVQINGRSSALRGEQLGSFLAQLPASAVKNVEVATNPSAKNDPEGTAGIINIVLNQEAELGLSGGINAGTGTTGMVNASGNIGKQAGPLTLLLSGNVYRDRRKVTGTSLRTNLANPVPMYVESVSAGRQSPKFGGVNLRSEYRFTKADALSFDAFLNGGQFGGENVARYTNLDDARVVTGLFDQYNERVSAHRSQDYTLAFRRTGGPLVPTFTSELRFSTNRSADDAELHGELRKPDAATGPVATPREHDVTSGRSPTLNLSADYTRPFGPRTKLETGFKGTDRHTESEFTAAYFDAASGTYLPAPARTRAFDYRERIGAAYGVLSRQVGTVQAQAGLRMERAATDYLVPGASQGIGSAYGSLFPSAILSYNLTEARQAKLSYSRRISRPNPFQLSPIEQRTDSRNIFRGNPALRPEYTDALELGFQDARSWGSLQLNPYLRRTTNAVRYIQLVDTSGSTLATFDNVASTTVLGTDLNVNYRAGGLTLFGGGSAWRYRSDATNLAGDLSARAFVWSLRANATYRLSAFTDVQGFASYRAPQRTEGGRQDAFVFTNVAIRYKVWGERGNISLRVADPFNLMRFGGRTQSLQAIEWTERRFGQRGLFISVSRTFGQQLKLRPRQDDPSQQVPSPTPGTP